MLFFILLVITAIFVSLCVGTDWEDTPVIHLIACILAVFTIINAFNIIMVHTSANADKAKYEQRYNSLVYQLESGVYDKENHDIVTGTDSLYNLYSEIERWNYDLAERKEKRHSLWYGIYYADIYDDFEFIKYPEIKTN